MRLRYLLGSATSHRHPCPPPHTPLGPLCSPAICPHLVLGDGSCRPLTSLQKTKRVPVMMVAADRRTLRMRALLRIVSSMLLGGCPRVSLSTGSTPKLLGTRQATLRSTRTCEWVNASASWARHPVGASPGHLCPPESEDNCTGTFPGPRSLGLGESVLTPGPRDPGPTPPSSGTHRRGLPGCPGPASPTVLLGTTLNSGCLCLPWPCRWRQQ